MDDVGQKVYDQLVYSFVTTMPTPMRKLSSEEIAKITITNLSVYSNVRKVAVENFLGTVHNNKHAYYASMNLEKDAKLYHWDEYTIHTIREGILLSAGVLDPIMLDEDFYTTEQIEAMENARRWNDDHLGVERRYKNE